MDDKTTDPGSHVIQSWPSARGLRVADLDDKLPGALEWAAHTSNPTSAAGKADKAACIAYWRQLERARTLTQTMPALQAALAALGAQIVDGPPPTP
jgi:hypothetical protein